MSRTQSNITKNKKISMVDFLTELSSKHIKPGGIPGFAVE